MPDLKDDLVFDLMTTKADNTRVDLFANESKGYDKKDLHKALMVAGFTPGLGNIADAVDALLYALEGEFGEAAISSTAMIPFLGQMVSARKVAKAGEEMVTVYRGVDKWKAGSMVKDGKFVGNPKVEGYKLFESDEIFPNTMLSTSKDLKQAKVYRLPEHLRGFPGAKPGPILEFEVPKSYIKKHAFQQGDAEVIFKDGLPKEFLKKVHKGK